MSTNRFEQTPFKQKRSTRSIDNKIAAANRIRLRHRAQQLCKISHRNNVSIDQQIHGVRAANAPAFFARERSKRVSPVTRTTLTWPNCSAEKCSSIQSPERCGQLKSTTITSARVERLEPATSPSNHPTAPCKLLRTSPMAPTSIADSPLQSNRTSTTKR